jgi:hypothetical protein
MAGQSSVRTLEQHLSFRNVFAPLEARANGETHCIATVQKVIEEVVVYEIGLESKAAMLG